MIGGTCQGQAALFRRMTQHDSPVFRIALLVMEHATREDSRLSRIIRVGVGAGFVDRHLRRDHKGCPRIEERHIVGDGGHMPVDKRDQTSRGDQHLLACGCLPEDLPVEGSALHVEPAVVA